jgi:hypothetical protein
MISEMLNALFLTYLVSEYLVETNVRHAGSPFHKRDWTRRLRQGPILISALALIALNVAERQSTVFAPLFRDAFHRFLHLPKVVLIMTVYFLALFADCRRSCGRSLRFSSFTGRIAIALCQLLPAYFLLAILISFGFLFVINLFEFMRWNVELLNGPIYYGTLYGPFSVIYWNVKRAILEDAWSSLPLARTGTMVTMM